MTMNLVEQIFIQNNSEKFKSKDFDLIDCNSHLEKKYKNITMHLKFRKS